jgi:hypothetical protein
MERDADSHNNGAFYSPLAACLGSSVAVKRSLRAWCDIYRGRRPGARSLRPDQVTSSSVYMPIA